MQTRETGQPVVRSGHHRLVVFAGALVAEQVLVALSHVDAEALSSVQTQRHREQLQTWMETIHHFRS